MGSEGSGRQIPGLRNTKRIRGSHTWARRQKDPKPDSHPEGVEVYATGGWEESECVIPGEICSSANGLMSSRDEMKDEQKSAEGILAIAHDGEGPNVRSGLGTKPRWTKQMQTGGLRCLRTPGR
jgi:hypothetical protein